MTCLLPTAGALCVSSEQRAEGAASPQAKTPGAPVIIAGSTCTTPSTTSGPSMVSTSERSTILAECQDHRVAGDLLQLTRWLRVAVVVQHHLLQAQRAVADLSDGSQPRDPYALLEGLPELDLAQSRVLRREGPRAAVSPGRPVCRRVKDADFVETLVDDVRDGAHN